MRDCVRIDGRPEAINRRHRYGDGEGDPVVGKGRRRALVTLVERKSGSARIGRTDSLKAEVTRRTTVRRRKALPASRRRSVTFDNGKELAEHAQRAQTLDLKVYFALPYRSWRRGTNENTNGRLRQFFPKAQISRGSVIVRWPAWKPYLTNVPVDDSASGRPLKYSPNACFAIDS
jgi:IS30 family transposase